MSLNTMEPNPVWVADAYDDAVTVLAAHAAELTYNVWGGDWCKDCRSQLPDFAAALNAAGVPADEIEHYPVDQDKEGERVEEFDVEYIPTVVVERHGEEIARFVEGDPVPIAVHLAHQIADVVEREHAI